MAKSEDLIGFIGDGTSTYFRMRGIAGALRAVDDTIGNIAGLVVASGNAYSEITLADFRKVVGILPPELDETAAWYMHKRFYYDVVYALAAAAGVANIFEVLADREGRLLGRAAHGRDLRNDGDGGFVRNTVSSTEQVDRAVFRYYGLPLRQAL